MVLVDVIDGVNAVCVVRDRWDEAATNSATGKKEGRERGKERG